MVRRPAVWLALLAIPATVVAVVLSRPREPPPRRPAERVVLLGFDGAAPNLLEPLVAEGRLPALKRLMERGAYGPLRTFKPVKSAVLWTSIATGKTMLKHGIVDWSFVDEAGLRVPFKGSSRRARTYWEILDEQGLSSGTLNWWLTHPPPRLRHGFLVSDAFRVAPEPRSVQPPEDYAALEALRPRPKDIGRELREIGLLGFRAEDARIPLQGMAREVVGSYRGYLLGDLAVDRASDEMWRRRKVEVFSTYFRFVDVIGHFGLHFAERAAYDEAMAADAAGGLTPEARARIDRAVAEAMRPAYELMDRTVAKYVERLDPRTLLILCSDHGFAWHKGAYTHYHRDQEPPPGVIFLAGPGVRASYRIQGATLMDVAPTILHAMGLETAADMDGGVLERAFDEGWRRRFPVTTRPTYESGDRPPPEASAGDRRLDEKVLEDLRTLGYIDTGDGEPPPQ
jgi:hypothetical protein